MELMREKKEARFLDPFNDFKESIRSCEIREDPLTRRRSRILHFPVRQMEKPDLRPLIEKSSEFCPFCPEMVEKITPKFIPENFPRERYRNGEAICFPNVFPYDENGAVTVMTEKHFVPIAEFSREVLRNAISCCVEFLNDVRNHQPDAIYQSINWNFLPLAGSSIIHPHLQITASSSPTNYYTDVLNSVAAYKKAKNGNLLHDLVLTEREKNERFISESDHLSWLVGFAPMGVFDIIGISKEALSPAELVGEILNETVSGILHTLKYIDSLNMYSLNMSIYFVLANEDFVPHMRICPRTSIPPHETSEINYMRMLHSESMTILMPEEVCGNIRDLWNE